MKIAVKVLGGIQTSSLTWGEINLESGAHSCMHEFLPVLLFLEGLCPAPEEGFRE